MKHSLTEEALLSAVTLKHSTFLWVELHLRTRNVCKHKKKITENKNRTFFLVFSGLGADVHFMIKVNFHGFQSNTFHFN